MLWAVHVAEGRPLHGLEVARGRVLYFAGKNECDVRMRWIAMAEHLNFDVNKIDVYFIPGIFDIPGLQQRIAQVVNELGGVSLLIVDTSAAYYGGDDENDNVQMGQHARMLRSLTKLPGDPCVLVLCHPTKHAGADNLLPRGGGAFLAECDGNLTCKPNDTVSTVHWQGKIRGPDFDEMLSEIVKVHARKLRDSKQRPISTVVARPLDDAAHEFLIAGTRNNEDRVMVVLRDHPGHSNAWIAEHLGWMSKKGKPQKAKAHRILQRLIGAKLATYKRDGYELTDAGRQAARKLPGEPPGETINETK
jgi:AAA domain